MVFKSGAEWTGNRLGRPKKVPPPPVPPPPKPADIKAIAREKSERAIAILVEMMEDKGIPPATRLAAANSLLDRGLGKPVAHIETSASKYDQMTDIELMAVILGKSVEEVEAENELLELQTIEHQDDGELVNEDDEASE